MTAEEIRAAEIDDATPNEARELCWFLREIAAQLAELNHNLRDVSSGGGKNLRVVVENMR